MISDIDNALLNLIKKGLSTHTDAVDIKFNQPNRDWSSRLSKPTINLFLFDIRENLRLRGAEQRAVYEIRSGIAEIRQNSKRIDLRYLLTAWAKEPEDEHLLLTDTLNVLVKYPYLPDSVCNETLKKQPLPIPLEAAVFQPEHGPTEKITDIWGVINNELHAGFILSVTITIDPFDAEVVPQVSEVGRTLKQIGDSESPSAAVPTFRTAYTIESEKYETALMSVVLAEKRIVYPVDEKGHFVIDKIEAGDFNLDILVKNKVVKRQKISIPDGNHTIIV